MALPNKFEKLLEMADIELEPIIGREEINTIIRNEGASVPSNINTILNETTYFMSIATSKLYQPEELEIKIEGNRMVLPLCTPLSEFTVTLEYESDGRVEIESDEYMVDRNKIIKRGMESEIQSMIYRDVNEIFPRDYYYLTATFGVTPNPEIKKAFKTIILAEIGVEGYGEDERLIEEETHDYKYKLQELSNVNITQWTRIPSVNKIIQRNRYQKPDMGFLAI